MVQRALSLTPFGWAVSFTPLPGAYVPWGVAGQVPAAACAPYQGQVPHPGFGHCAPPYAGGQRHGHWDAGAGGGAPGFQPAGFQAVAYPCARARANFSPARAHCARRAEPGQGATQDPMRPSPPQLPRQHSADPQPTRAAPPQLPRHRSADYALTAAALAGRVGEEEEPAQPLGAARPCAACHFFPSIMQQKSKKNPL